jgi:hypothetical protein
MTMGIESQLFGWQHPTRAANVENLRLALMFWLRPEGRAVEAADYDERSNGMVKRGTLFGD